MAAVSVCRLDRASKNGCHKIHVGLPGQVKMAAVSAC